MASLSDFAPHSIQRPIELMPKWVGETPGFILKIMMGLVAIHSRPLRNKTMVQQTKSQSMPEKPAKRAIEKSLNESIIYSPKKGKITRTELR